MEAGAGIRLAVSCQLERTRQRGLADRREGFTKMDQPGNPLSLGVAPQDGSPAVGPVASAPDPASAFSAAHGQAKAMYDQTSTALKLLRGADTELQGLSKKGDAVTADDVIESVGRLVAAGTHSAKDMAQMLSTLPPGNAGPAIATWVQQHLQNVRQMMMKVQQNHALTRHEMGVSALRAMHANALSPPPVGGMPAQGSA